MNKKQIWELILEREFDLPFQETLFELIEKNIDRIEFVKDHIGLRDILFIAEKATQGFFVSTLFTAIDTDVSKQNTYEQNEKVFSEKVNEDPIEVLAELTNFFQNTDRTLYVGIGFIETTNPDFRGTMIPIQLRDGSFHEVSLYEMMIAEAIRKGKAKSASEASRQIRMFPKWYGEFAKMPEEVIVITKEDEEKIRIEKIEKEKMEIMQKIDDLLDKKNRNEDSEEVQERFKELAARYKQLS